MMVIDDIAFTFIVFNNVIYAKFNLQFFSQQKRRRRKKKKFSRIQSLTLSQNDTNRHPE
jgi:hypothetical protein